MLDLGEVAFPFETKRLWDKMYRGAIYFGLRGVAIQAMSGIDIACWDIKGKVHVAQPDISRCGGLTVAKRIAELRNVAVCPHARMSSPRHHCI